MPNKKNRKIGGRKIRKPKGTTSSVPSPYQQRLQRLLREGKTLTKQGWKKVQTTHPDIAKAGRSISKKVRGSKIHKSIRKVLNNK